MTNKLNWVAFLDRLPGNPSDRAIAQSIGISHSAISRWRNEGQDPRPAQAVAIARHFGLHPLNALVAAGFLTLDDIDALFEGKQSIEVLSVDETPTLELIEVLAKRVRALEGDK